MTSGIHVDKPGMENGGARSRESRDPATEGSPQVRKLLGEHHRLNLRVEELEHELECLHGSISWRLTSPLRSARGWIGYVRSIFSFSRHQMTLHPFSDLIRRGDSYRITGPTPYFLLESSKGRPPCGPVMISVEVSDADGGFAQAAPSFSLYADVGGGFSEELRFSCTPDEMGRCTVRLPDVVRHLRLDPGAVAGTYPALTISIREISAPRVLADRFARCLEERRLCGQGAVSLILDLSRRLLRGGWISVKQYLLGHEFSRIEMNRAYRKWVRKYDSLQPTDIIAYRKEQEKLSYRPKMSVLMPVYNTPEKWLRKAIDSVLNQIYPDWELCIADDASTRPSVREVLEEYALRDQRIRITYRDQNEHISASSNTALQMAEGEFVALLDHDDELAPDALFQVVKLLNHNQELDLIFSDEDRISKGGQRLDPYFKPGWNRELFLGQNLISHLGVYRACIAREVQFRTGYEGSQDWDFALRCLERTTDEQIAHIPRVLYHWRLVPGTVSFTVETKGEAFNAAERAVSEHLRRTEQPGEVESIPGGGLRVRRGQLGADSEQIQILGQVGDVLRGDLAGLESLTFLTGADLLSQLEQLRNESPAGIVVCCSPRTAAVSENWPEVIGRCLSVDDVGVVGGCVRSAAGQIESCGLVACSNNFVIKRLHGLPRAQSSPFGHAELAAEIPAPAADFFAFRGELLEKIERDQLEELALRSEDQFDCLALLIAEAAIAERQRIIYLPELRVEIDHLSRVAGIRAADFVGAGVLQKSQQYLNPNLDSSTTGYYFSFPP